jgi:hypothetical protein
MRSVKRRPSIKTSRLRRIFLRTVIWPLIGSFGAWYIFGWFAASEMLSHADEISGQTFPLTVATGRYGRISGYTQPWIGLTYNGLFAITITLFVIALLASALIYAVEKKD